MEKKKNITQLITNDAAVEKVDALELNGRHRTENKEKSRSE